MNIQITVKINCGRVLLPKSSRLSFWSRCLFDTEISSPVIRVAISATMFNKNKRRQSRLFENRWTSRVTSSCTCCPCEVSSWWPLLFGYTNCAYTIVSWPWWGHWLSQTHTHHIKQRAFYQHWKANSFKFSGLIRKWIFQQAATTVGMTAELFNTRL